MKNKKTNDLIIKFVFGIILVISLFLIISGLTEKEETVIVNNDEVLETGLIVDPSNIRMVVGDEQQITATVTPSNATYKNLNWEVGNTNIVSIDNGKVTALSPGTTYVKITTEKQKIGRVVNVIVTEQEKLIKEIIVNEPNIEMYVGDTKKIEYKIDPSDATNRKISYNIDNKEVVGFDRDGNIVGIKEGKAVVTLSSSNDIKATINITVKNKEIPVTSVTLSPNSLQLEVNAEKTIVAKVKPNNATNKEITWTSSNTKIATVNDGKVKGLSEGSTTIIAKTNNGKTATAKVSVGSPTKNKTAIFFGDSITQGSGNTWANIIGRDYDLASSINAGKSGAFISQRSNESLWITAIAKKYSSQKFDYVILHGGINDASAGVELGTYTKSDFSGNYNTKTILGGLEYLLYTVKKQWPNAKVGFIINYNTPLCESCSKRTGTFYPKMMEVLKKWNISYINLYSGSTPNGVKYSDLLKVNTKTYITDGVHVNSEGYRLITPYIYQWMKTL